VTRLNKILLAALAVQLVLAIVMLGRDHGAPVARLAAVAPDLDAAQVTRVQIFDRRERGATGAAKPAVDLQKAGDGWTLASHFAYPADPSKVTTLLSNLAAMKARGPMATSAARHVQLGVADDVYERKVVLTTPAGERTFFVGQSAGGRRTALRKGGDARVYAVGGVSAYTIDATPRGWVTTDYVTVAKDDVAALEVKTDKGTIAVERAGGGWTLALNGAPATLAAGESVDTAKVDGLLAKLTTLTLAEPADPARDASHPTATITLRLEPPAPAADADAGVAASAPPQERVLDVLADGDRYWVRERGNPRAVLVDKAQLAGVVDLTRDGVVTKATGNAAAPKPAAPAPGPAPG